jgi:hypothetical protein
MTNQLRLRIKQMIENGTISGMEKQKMENLLRTKARNPYCMFRHSAITEKSDRYPEYAIIKMARWVMDTRQKARYIQQKIGQDIKNKMLQDAGILVKEQDKVQATVHQCQHCHYINNFETEICARCDRPVDQVVFEKLKT